MKWSLLVEKTGNPLSLVIAGANVHDTRLLDATLEGVVVDRPSPADQTQHLCLDKGYDGAAADATVHDHEYSAHIRRRGETPPDCAEPRQHPARRWVVERTIAWLQGFRALLVRYEVYAENYLGLLQFACALVLTRVWLSTAVEESP